MFLSRTMRIIAAVAIPGLSAGLTFGFAPAAFRPQDAKSALDEGKPAPPAPMTTPITVRGRATDSEAQARRRSHDLPGLDQREGRPAWHDDHRPGRGVYIPQRSAPRLSIAG